jgi:hypothetical protein
MERIYEIIKTKKLVIIQHITITIGYFGTSLKIEILWSLIGIFSAKGTLEFYMFVS